MTAAQLEMVWPLSRLTLPPTLALPDGFGLRTFQPGDEARFYEIMAQSSWPEWGPERLEVWIGRILPEAWYMVVEQATDLIVATAMGVHSHTPLHPFGGELGWVGSDPRFRGRGLGYTVSAAVTRRLLNMGYRHLHLYTDDHRLAAIKTYFRLGYQPLLHQPDMPDRWARICEQIDQAFLPDHWVNARTES